jgi:hypothetical protein
MLFDMTFSMSHGKNNTSKIVILPAGVATLLMISGRLGPSFVQGGKAEEN